MAPQENGTFTTCRRSLKACKASRKVDCVPVQALGTKILPRLWAHMARSMGLPLEAPKEARRGWDVAALRRGAHGILPQHTALLGLFCRYVADQPKPCTCPDSSV